MNMKNIMLSVNSLEKLHKALQILLPKMTDFDIKNCNFIFQSETPAYVPGITVTLNQNSFFKQRNMVILNGY